MNSNTIKESDELLDMILEPGSAVLDLVQERTDLTAAGWALNTPFAVVEEEGVDEARYM